MGVAEPVDPLDSIFERHDAFAVLTALTLGSYHELPFREDRWSGKLPSFVVEHAQARAARCSRRRPLTKPAGPLSMAELAEAAEDSSRALASEEVLQGLTQTPDAKAQVRLRIWQIFSHDPGRPENEGARLRAALDPFAPELEERLGFNAEQAETVLMIFDALTMVGLARCFGFPLAEIESLQERLGEEIGSGTKLVDVPPALGELASCNATSLLRFAAACDMDLPAENLSAFLARFSMPFGAIEEERDPVRALWDVRERPLLRDDEDNYIWPMPPNLAFAIRPVCERALREAEGDVPQRYDKAKARALEAEALEELHNGLMVDGSWRTLLYPHAEDEKLEVEGDGLILLDSVALAVECKAVELSPSARQGSAPALAKKLQDAIVKGAEQGQRTREALLGGRQVTGVPLWEHSREIISPGPLSRTVPIVVVLEPLGAVTSALWELVDASEAKGPQPWIVNIDDLRWFDRELKMPARLLHYMVVRQRIASSGRLGAVDEADWFWMYYAHGGAALSEKLKFLGDVNAGFGNVVGPEIRRGSLLPGNPFHTKNEPLLTALHESRLPGWVEVALALLDLGDEADHRLEKARMATHEREKVSWLSEPPVAQGGSHLIVGIGDRDQLTCELEARIDGYIAAAEAAHAHLICSLGIEASSGEPCMCSWRLVNADASPA